MDLKKFIEQGCQVRNGRGEGQNGNSILRAQSIWTQDRGNAHNGIISEVGRYSFVNNNVRQHTTEVFAVDNKTCIIKIDIKSVRTNNWTHMNEMRDEKRDLPDFEGIKSHARIYHCSIPKELPKGKVIKDEFNRVKRIYLKLKNLDFKINIHEIEPIMWVHLKENPELGSDLRPKIPQIKREMKKGIPDSLQAADITIGSVRLYYQGESLKMFGGDELLPYCSYLTNQNNEGNIFIIDLPKPCMLTHAPEGVSGKVRAGRYQVLANLNDLHVEWPTFDKRVEGLGLKQHSEATTFNVGTFENRLV